MSCESSYPPTAHAFDAEDAATELKMSSMLVGAGNSVSRTTVASLAGSKTSRASDQPKRPFT